jgi:hypothetical protein
MYVLPSESPRPVSTWGLNLGQVIDCIRREGTYANFVDRDARRLKEPSFAVIYKPELAASEAIDEGKFERLFSAILAASSQSRAPEV